MPIAMIEAFIGQPAKHNCLVLIITRLRQNKNDVICPVADDDFHGSSKRTTPPSPTGIAADCGECLQAAGAVARKANDPLNPMNRVGSNCGGAYETFARGPHIQHQSRAQR
jgi:hypothetical protein